MARAAALVLIAALASGCASPAPRRPAGDLVLTSELADPGADFTEGELATFLLRIRNEGSRYVILRDLEEPGAGSVVTWQRPMAGLLRYQADSDEFLYDGSARDTTARPVFNTSLLAPGEEIQFKPRLRLLNLPRTFTLNYFAFDAAAARERIYALRGRSTKPEVYAKFSGPDELELMLKADPSTGLASHRTVIFPFAETISAAPSHRAVTVDARYVRRGFTLDQALARAGATRADLKATSYYAAGAVWALQLGDGAFWIGPGAKTELPSISSLDLFCHALDSLALEAVVEFELHAAIAQVFASEVPAFPAAAVQDAGRRRFIVLVRRPDLDAFLKSVRRLTYRIQVSPAPSGWKLLVTH